MQALPFDKELIVVDDGSTDGTRAILERLAAECDVDASCVQPQPGQGRGDARRRFAHVDGDIVVIQDADLEYDPATYPR